MWLYPAHFPPKTMRWEYYNKSLNDILMSDLWSKVEQRLGKSNDEKLNTVFRKLEHRLKVQKISIVNFQCSSGSFCGKL